MNHNEENTLQQSGPHSGGADILQDALSGAFETEPTPPQHVDIPEADILGSAFVDSFSPPRPLNAHKQLASNNPEDVLLKPPPPMPSGESSDSTTVDESWKNEYDDLVRSWRADSAHTREKAEAERSKWSAKREEIARSKASTSADDHEWEPVNQTKSSSASTVIVSMPQSPNHANSNNLPPAEPLTSRQKVHAATSPLPESLLPQNLLSYARKNEVWEDLPSMSSSLPSSVPEHLETPPLDQHQPEKSKAPAPLSATRAAFDPTLTTKSRASAILSSLAINMLLPFVNGIMLGFGEIFAKEFVFRWLGWKAPGSVAANVGLGVKTPSGKRK